MTVKEYSVKNLPRRKLPYAENPEQIHIMQVEDWASGFEEQERLRLKDAEKKAAEMEVKLRKLQAINETVSTLAEQVKLMADIRELEGYIDAKREVLGEVKLEVKP